MLSLFGDRQTMGALNLYAEPTNPNGIQRKAPTAYGKEPGPGAIPGPASHSGTEREHHLCASGDLSQGFLSFAIYFYHARRRRWRLDAATGALREDSKTCAQRLSVRFRVLKLRLKSLRGGTSQPSSVTGAEFTRRAIQQDPSQGQGWSRSGAACLASSVDS